MFMVDRNFHLCKLFCIVMFYGRSELPLMQIIFHVRVPFDSSFTWAEN
jgi:hypothetical protein